MVWVIPPRRRDLSTPSLTAILPSHGIRVHQGLVGGGPSPIGSSTSMTITE